MNHKHDKCCRPNACNCDSCKSDRRARQLQQSTRHFGQEEPCIACKGTQHQLDGITPCELCQKQPIPTKSVDEIARKLALEQYPIHSHPPCEEMTRLNRQIAEARFKQAILKATAAETARAEQEFALGSGYHSRWVKTLETVEALQRQLRELKAGMNEVCLIALKSDDEITDAEVKAIANWQEKTKGIE